MCYILCNEMHTWFLTSAYFLRCFHLAISRQIRTKILLAALVVHAPLHASNHVRQGMQELCPSSSKLGLQPLVLPLMVYACFCYNKLITDLEYSHFLYMQPQCHRLSLGDYQIVQNRLGSVFDKRLAFCFCLDRTSIHALDAYLPYYPVHKNICTFRWRYLQE